MIIEKLEVIDHLDLNASSENLTDVIKQVLNISDTVYVFRRLNHFDEQIPLVQWLHQQDVSKIEKIILNFDHGKFRDEINGSGEPIYKLNLTDDNRQQFIERFSISIRDAKGYLDFKVPTDEMFVDDPLYDQYDYVFMYDGKVILTTYIHIYEFTYHREILCQRKK